MSFLPSVLDTLDSADRGVVLTEPNPTSSTSETLVKVTLQYCVVIGIHQNTTPEHVTALIEAVHKHSSRSMI